MAHPDARYDAWMDVVDRVNQLLDEYDEHEPTPWPDLPHALERLVESQAEPADAAHAIAWVLDERFSRTFPDDWIAAADEDAFDLQENDLYPVLETPWAIFHPYLSRPASMTDPRRDELAHMRRFEASALPLDKVVGVRVHRVTGLLRDVLATMSTVATAHPNLTREEFEWPRGRKLWPVTIRDPKRQKHIAEGLVGAALRGRCRLVVLPELSTNGDTIEAVRALLDDRYDEDEEPAIVLTGSHHVEVDEGQRRNRAITLIAGTTVELHQDKLVPYRPDGSIEDLRGDGTLHLYQDGPFRLAAVVCKDLLDSDVEGLLERLGVNLLLVPAMSAKTSNFPLAAGRLLHTAQTLTVLANGPLIDKKGRSVAHASLIALPTAGRSAAWWPPGGAHAKPPSSPVWVEHSLSGARPRRHLLPERHDEDVESH